MEAFLVIVTNVLFQAARTYNTRMIANDLLVKFMWSGLLVKVFWLVSTSIGIKGFIEGDWFIVILYLASGTLGDYIGIKIDKKKEK